MEARVSTLMQRTAGSAVEPSEPGAGHRRSRTSHRRALGVGLAVSAAVHVVALALYPTVSRLDLPGDLPRTLPVPRAVGGGMTVVDLVAVDAIEDAERPPAPAEVRDVEAPTVSPGRPQVGDPRGTGLVAPGPTAAERLRPSLEDRRIWAPLDPELNELTPEQRAELELAGLITDWQDSLSVEAERQRALTDWTTTDGQGRRWGVSEGKLHLGDVTLPLPFSFGTPVGKRDEVARRAWEWEEIQRGSITGETRDSWKERAQAIRERRDRERAAQTRPDTSRVRR